MIGDRVRIRARVQLQHGGVHLGDRAERPGADMECTPDFKVVAHEVGEKAYLTIAGSGEQPVGNLLLKHDSDVLQPAFELDKTAQDGGAFIIRQVRNQFPRRSRGRHIQNAVHIAFEEISRYEVKPPVGRISLLERSAEDAVDFDCPDLCPSLQKQIRKGAFPRSYFQKEVRFIHPGKIYDAPGDAWSDEEVLAETPVCFLGHSVLL